MLRFIFVCMTMVCLSLLSIASQYMLNNGQSGAAPSATVAAVQQDTLPSGPSFEEIYASAPQADFADDAAALNNIETAAGSDEFSAAFTNTAPKALADEEVTTVNGMEILRP